MKLGDIGMAVTHNSPYLLKRADGSFIDPETGERLGFDHRFMASGEGCQAHGWGSYFSENDRRNYANNQRNPNKYKGVTSDEIDKLNLERTERVIAMCILGDMDLYPQRTVEELIQEYIRDIKINTALVEKKLALLLKIKNIGDDSVKYWNKSVERQKLCEKIDKILGDSEAGRNVYMNIASSLRYDRMAFSRIINEYETTCDSVCVENEEELAAFERLNPDDFERVEKERHHYEVEIPDNDGTNYIEEQKTLTDKQIQMVLDGLSRWKVIDVRTNDWLKPYTNPDGKPYSYLRGGNWKGENLYKEFCAAFDYEHNYRDMKPADAGRRASQFLHDCGFVGIHYSSYSDGECYVIFDEADAKIVNHELFGLSGDAPRFNVGDWIEYFPLVAEAKRGKYKGKLWVHNITAVGDTFYTVDSWCVQTHQPHRNRQMTISGQQEWYRKIAQPQWATDHDRRLRLAKAKAKALKLKLELMKIEGINEKNAEIHSRNNRVKLGDTNKRSAIMENNIIFADILSEAEKLYKYGLQVFGTDWLRTLLPERITQEAKRGLYGIANKNAAALFIARRCEAASAAQRGVVADRPTLQGDVIIEAFAKEHDFWIENTDSYFHSKFGQPMSYGSEATIYCDRQRRMVVKTIDTELYDNNVSKAIYRFLIHNILFPETWFNIVAFGRSQYGLFEIIVEQDYIDGEFATIRQFEEKLASIGLVKNKGDWENELFFVSDVKSKNAIVDEDGNVFVIDCYLELKEQNQ